jgi:hypothetical protein
MKYFCCSVSRIKDFVLILVLVLITYGINGIVYDVVANRALTKCFQNILMLRSAGNSKAMESVMRLTNVIHLDSDFIGWPLHTNDFKCPLGNSKYADFVVKEGPVCPNGHVIFDSNAPPDLYYDINYSAPSNTNAIGQALTNTSVGIRYLLAVRVYGYEGISDVEKRRILNVLKDDTNYAVQRGAIVELKNRYDETSQKMSKDQMFVYAFWASLFGLILASLYGYYRRNHVCEITALWIVLGYYFAAMEGYRMWMFHPVYPLTLALMAVMFIKLAMWRWKQYRAIQVTS